MRIARESSHSCIRTGDHPTEPLVLVLQPPVRTPAAAVPQPQSAVGSTASPILFFLTRPSHSKEPVRMLAPLLLARN